MNMSVKKCPKILMTMTMVLIVTLNVPGAEGQNVFLPNTRNYVFAHLGKALMTADYGHIDSGPSQVRGRSTPTQYRYLGKPAC